MLLAFLLYGSSADSPLFKDDMGWSCADYRRAPSECLSNNDARDQCPEACSNVREYVADMNALTSAAQKKKRRLQGGGICPTQGQFMQPTEFECKQEEDDGSIPGLPDWDLYDAAEAQYNARMRAMYSDLCNAECSVVTFGEISPNDPCVLAKPFAIDPSTDIPSPSPTNPPSKDRDSNTPSPTSCSFCVCYWYLCVLIALAVCLLLCCLCSLCLCCWFSMMGDDGGNDECGECEVEPINCDPCNSAVPLPAVDGPVQYKPMPLTGGAYIPGCRNDGYGRVV